MNLDLNNAIRSAVILVVGLPITVGVVVGATTDPTPASDRVTARVKAELIDGCTDYMVSKTDSKLERQGQDKIDEVLGADGANYKELCGWVM